MSDDSYQGNSFLIPPSASKLRQSLSKVIKNWLEYLPLDLIPIILMKLPPKSLIRFSSVSKSWMSTIKDPEFILDHTRNLNNPNATHLLLLHSLRYKRHPARTGVVFDQDSYTLLHDDSAISEHCKIEVPVALEQELINPCFRVVGTCNGLVLLSDDDMKEYGYTTYTIVIWNPSIRKYVTLPEPGVRFSTGLYNASLGLGCDANGNDYKVVRLTDHYHEPEYDSRSKAQIYSLANGSWGMLRPCPLFFVSGSFEHVLVNGALHWVAGHWIDEERDTTYFILTFDVAGESFGEIKLPMIFYVEEDYELRVSVSGDGKSIALFVRRERRSGSYLDIWVMTGYSDEKSWQKLMDVSRLGPERCVLRAFIFQRSGEVILQLDSSHELVSLDVVSKEFKRLGIYGGRSCSIFSFEESLVLLDRNDAASY